MTNPALKQQALSLSAILVGTQTVDAETRAALLAVQREIARITEHHDTPVTEKLEELAVRFEADHPAAGSAIRQAIDALSKAGI